MCKFLEKNIDNIYTIWIVISAFLIMMVELKIVIFSIIIGLCLYLYGYYKLERVVSRKTFNLSIIHLLGIYTLVRVHL